MEMTEDILSLESNSTFLSCGYKNGFVKLFEDNELVHKYD